MDIVKCYSDGPEIVSHEQQITMYVKRLIRPINTKFVIYKYKYIHIYESSSITS